MKTRIKFLAGLNASLLAGAALVLVAGAAPASAHTPEVLPTCSGVSVDLVKYRTTADDATPNVLTVTIDNVEVAHEKFGTTFSGQYDFDDTTIGHEYTVVVDALGTDYDRSFEGTTEACEAPPALTDASAAVHVLPPTCDEPARLVLEDAVNAVWSTPTAVEGPAEYSVVATADDGHLFSTGEDTETFTGELAGKLDSVEDGCQAPPAPIPAHQSRSPAWDVGDLD